MRDYSDKEAERQAQMSRDKKAKAAWRRLEQGQKVTTPGGWSGFIAEKMPDQLRVFVETWDKSETYYAHEVNPENSEISGVSL